MTEKISYINAAAAGKQALPGQQQPIKINEPDKTKPKDHTSGIAGTFDQFLTLLTTQLQNQDPLSPMESEQFTSQLVGFAGVEQSINSNLKLDSLIQLQAGQQAIDSVALIGKEVQAAGERSVVKNGQIKWQYNLPQDVQHVEIQIKDEKGRVVLQADSNNPSSPYARQLSEKRGPHSFEWDGRRLAHGKKAEDGEMYSLIVNATDAQGKAVPASTNIYGHVSGVSTVGNRTQLIVDGKISIGIENLVSVNNQASGAAQAPEASANQNQSSDQTDSQSSTNEDQQATKEDNTTDSRADSTADSTDTNNTDTDSKEDDPKDNSKDSQAT